MTVAICDDEILFRNQLKELLTEYKKEHRIHLDIIEFSNGLSLLNYDSPFDVVFLDYDMPGINGIETGMSLRERNRFCCLIYLTNYPEHVFESFKADAFRYLVKPVKPFELTEALDTYIINNKMLSPIVVTVDGELLTISSKDIVYIEGAGKYCYIRTFDNSVKSSKTLAKVLELLPKQCFCRTHKSFAVNFHCIVSIKDSCITLVNGEKASLSRHYSADFKRAYKNFLKNYIPRT